MTSEPSPTAEASKESTPCFLGSSAPDLPSAKPSSPGRDEHCGLRIAVTKATDHMSISALATQALKQRQQVMKNRFRYCYECGRSIAIRLAACTRCKEVFYCSKSCKLKAWNARHREECVRLTGKEICCWILLICCLCLLNSWVFQQGHPMRKFSKTLEISFSAFFDCFRAF